MSINNCNRIRAMMDDLRPIVSQVPMNQADFKIFMANYNLGSNESILNNINTCSNVAVNIGSNIITVPRECVVTVENACRQEQERGYNYEECYRRNRPSIRNITQINIADVRQTCNIRSLLNSDLAQRNTDLALTLKLLLGNHIVSCNHGVENSFNFLNESNTAINVLNNCINSSFIIQSNNLSQCYANDIYQKNIANVIQNCTIESNVSDEQIINNNGSESGSGSGSESGSYRVPHKEDQKRITFVPSKLRRKSSSSSTNTIIAIGVIIIMLICSSCFMYMYTQ